MDQMAGQIAPDVDAPLLSLLEHLQDGVCLFDADQRLIACNARYTEIYNLPPEAAEPGVTLNEVLRCRIARGSIPAVDAEVYIANRQKAVADGTLKNEVHHLQDGRVLSVRHKPTPGGGWLTTHTDISEIYRLKAEIEHMAFHDQLTGLANRRHMERSLEQARGARRREGDRCGATLTYIDLDAFKPVNDRFGHAAGDHVLKAVSERLVRCYREEDTVARLGGDEFAVLQRDLDDFESLRRVADRTLDALAEPIVWGEDTASIGASLGIVHAYEGFECDRLWQQADKAMYRAKDLGGCRYVISQYEVGSAENELAAGAA